jgi:hypothetical protein
MLEGNKDVYNEVIDELIIYSGTVMIRIFKKFK